MTQVSTRKIAVPLAGEDFSAHFGQSTQIAVFEVDSVARSILGQARLPVPAQHACGLAGWMQEQGVHGLIVGGIGGGALRNLAAAGIRVFAGTPNTAPDALVQACLEGQLAPAVATCQHPHPHGAHDHGHGGACHCRSTTPTAP